MASRASYTDRVSGTALFLLETGSTFGGLHPVSLVPGT